MVATWTYGSALKDQTVIEIQADLESELQTMIDDFRNANTALTITDDEAITERSHGTSSVFQCTIRFKGKATIPKHWQYDNDNE